MENTLIKVVKSWSNLVISPKNRVSGYWQVLDRLGSRKWSSASLFVIISGQNLVSFLNPCFTGLWIRSDRSKVGISDFRVIYTLFYKLMICKSVFRPKLQHSYKNVKVFVFRHFYSCFWSFVEAQGKKTPAYAMDKLGDVHLVGLQVSSRPRQRLLTNRWRGLLLTCRANFARLRLGKNLARLRLNQGERPQASPSDAIGAAETLVRSGPVLAGPVHLRPRGAAATMSSMSSAPRSRLVLLRRSRARDSSLTIRSTASALRLALAWPADAAHF